MLQAVDSRKRPLSPDADRASSSSLNSKKRAVNTSSGANSPRPKSNGDLPHDEPKDENVEVRLHAFRKEAIYRRMRHYARELERAQTTIEELEKRKNTAEAGMATMEACWNQLLETLRSLVRSEKLPPADDRTNELLDLVRKSSEEDEEREEDDEEGDDDESTDYQIVMQDLVASSQSLIAQVAQLAPHSPPDMKDLRNKLHVSQKETTSLRSEVHLLRGRLSDAQAETDTLRASLQNAENQLERAKSRTIQRLSEKKTTEMNGDATPPVKKEGSPMEASGLVPPVANGFLPTEDDSRWKSLAESREQEIINLSNERLATLDELNRLKLQVNSPSEEVIVASGSYKILQEQANQLKSDVDEYKARWTAVKDELENLKANHRAMHEEAVSKCQGTIDELQSSLQKREADCLRLRETRDSITAELSVRRARDMERTNGVAQLKVLVDTRGERISVLLSEIRRLKAAIAASTTDSDLLRYVMGLNVSGEEGAQVQPSYVADLQARLESAEARLRAVEGGDGRAAEAEIELAKYRRAFGEWVDAFAQGTQNAVAAKEAELKAATLKCTEQEAALNDLYGEVDKLSVAWETLDKQNKLKIFELAALEEKLLKVTTEKAKADNKYFQVMKAKETQDAERKSMDRHLKRQMTVVEKHLESEKSLRGQLVVADKESVSLKRMIQMLKDRVEEQMRELNEHRIRAESERVRMADLEKQRSRADAAVIEARRLVTKHQEEATRAQEEVKRATAAKNAATGPASGRELELQKENRDLMTLLRCSTCKLNFKSHVLLKCMHSTLCRCIDARITTRQRKCPACNMAFGAQDVQQLYFQ
ncbi:E3 ubiquitin-protein ligase BRE1 [Ceratobasidium sp. AG-Ba]|nr:E3 ubiquitin-protein ligase BRE1 [Ceratobasidium sp. AG-Ba]